MLEKKHWVD